MNARRDVVRVFGPDTWTFLQNLLSQDVSDLGDGDRRTTLLLTPQGKVDVVASIARDGDDAVLETEPGFGEQLVASLTRFKIRTKVDFAVTPAATVDTTTFALAEAERIRAGVPRLGADLDASVIPQEAFLERDAVSFTKGCFIGQELVCRIDSRGHVNRFLRHIVPDDPAVLLPVGGEVVVNEKVVGTITSSATGVALGFVRREVEPPAPGLVGTMPVRVTTIGEPST